MVARAVLRRRGTAPRRLSIRLSGPVLALALAGCATRTLDAGVELGKAGQAAATQMAQNTSISADNMTAVRRAVAFNDGFNGVVGNPDSASYLSKMTSIQGKLGAYAKLLNSLATAYGALGDLAAYDSMGVDQGAVTNLAKDANAFGSSVGLTLALPEKTLNLASAGLGLAARREQANRVKAASAAIEEPLEKVIEILARPDIRDQLIPAQQQVQIQLSTASDTLFDAGLFGYASVVDALGAPMGLKSNDKTAALVATDTAPMPKVRAGLRNAAGTIADEKIAQVGPAYDASLRALRALRPMHEALADGGSLDIGRLESATAELKAIAASLNPPAPASAAAKDK